MPCKGIPPKVLFLLCQEAMGFFVLEKSSNALTSTGTCKIPLWQSGDRIHDSRETSNSLTQLNSNREDSLWKIFFGSWSGMGLRTILWRSDSITKHTHPRNADVFYLPIIPSNLAESLHQTKPGNMWTFSMTSHSSFGGKDLRSGARFDVVCTMGTHVSFIFRG